MEELACPVKKILVIDDYHFANAPQLDLLLEQFVRRRISGLHLMILYRTRPAINVQELKLKGYCHQLRSSLFELSREEIREYIHREKGDMLGVVEFAEQNYHCYVELSGGCGKALKA